MNQNEYYFPKLKKKNINRYCEIRSVASFVPETILSTDDIIKNYGLTFKSPAIIKSVGVDKRHVADEVFEDSDLLCLAAQKCLNQCDFRPDCLSRIFVNKYIGDNILPMTASKLKLKMGNKKAIQAFDIDGGISSFLIGFDLISKYINTGDEHILLASGGIINRMVSKTDPRVAFLFGDAATAVLFSHSDEKHILASYFYSNYEFYELANALSPLTIVDMGLDFERSLLFDTYRMDNWKKAEEFYRQASIAVSNSLLEESGLLLKDIDMILVTENNKRIWEITLETLGFSEAKSISLIKDYGNTMSAMLPLQLDIGFSQGKIKKGMKIMMISHGEGISGGGIIYKV
jgi:3-oxoacyl-[acyl-carrier-protein] synthase-3